MGRKVGCFEHQRMETALVSQQLLACPVCRGSASCIWIDERRVFLVECENCTTFTITEERSRAFQDAWRSRDRQLLMFLEAISRYLRLGGEDCDREITAANWMSFAIEGEHEEDDPPQD